MNTVIRVQILDVAIWISDGENTLGKGMYPALLPPMGKQWDKLISLTLAISLGKSKS